jgi:hypothetical protein
LPPLWQTTLLQQHLAPFYFPSGKTSKALPPIKNKHNQQMETMTPTYKIKPLPHPTIPQLLLASSLLSQASPGC